MTFSIRLFPVLASVALAVVLSGCAGTDFKRPEAQVLTVGKSTPADIIRVMGEPRQSGESLKNDIKIKTMQYVYAEGASTGRFPGVVPARAMVFSTYKDVLVGQQFVSSFPGDATDFDEARIPAIVKGKTTRPEVLAAFGKPSLEYVYPMIKTEGEQAVGYSYGHAKGNAFNMKFFNQALVVSFDAKGVVSDIEFSSTGEK